MDDAARPMDGAAGSALTVLGEQLSSSSGSPRLGLPAQQQSAPVRPGAGGASSDPLALLDSAAAATPATVAARAAEGAPAAEAAAGAEAGGEPACPEDTPAAGGQLPRGKRPKPQRLPASPRPTHFLAVPALSPAAGAAIAAAQSALRAAAPGLAPCCVDAAGAHLTVFVMHLETESALARAREELARLGAALRAAGLLAPLRLRLRGLGHFRRQVRRAHARRGAWRANAADGSPRTAALWPAGGGGRAA
jgi:hypothetical protein